MTNKILWKTLKHSPSLVGAALLLSAGSALATEKIATKFDITSQVAPVTTEDIEDSISPESNLAIAHQSEPPSQPVELAQTQPETDPEITILGIEQINQYSGLEDSMEQVTSVSQLSDVQPTDWAFQALQSLVERYGCIAGYPDGTFRGNRAMTRFEFAAGLNACLERVNELIAASVANLVTREDLAVIQRLQEEFAAELATLRGRVYALEARTAELEANQFSTTTKLSGEVVFWAGDSFGDRSRHNVAGGPFGRASDDPTQTYLGYRSRLNFDSSFSGRDRLRIRLEAVDIPNLRSFGLNNTLMARTSIDGRSNGFRLDDLNYRFPAFDGKARFWVGANALGIDNILDVLSPLESASAGSISRFGRRNPAVFRGPGGAGAGANFTFGSQPRFKLNLAYLAGNASDATQSNGLFNGSNSAGAQLVYEPNRNLAFAVEYARKYFSTEDVNIAGGTGSWISERPFGNNATSSDNLGLQFNWRVLDKFQLGGWFGATWAHQQRNGSDSATILNWAVTMGFPDAFSEGDLGGIIIGMPPKVTNHDRGALEDRDTSFHIEAFYRYAFNDYISITPGFFVVTNPDHNSHNANIFVGTLRTTFRF
ncbi:MULTISPECIES: iron uptake porin [Arthrospira]|jgi:hypothetical protein|uniref:SLH domain-containing protein n=1 Tax=Limnospira platensis NIES-46 TaxID=1236695 RepID=A0A5M3T7N5_LIMPL|nr:MULTISPECIES: iron uptake porin [Arthrospira]AMW27362.1 hypothetical protein AP285_04530 [Arthrospira platensis YZ]KDR57711.1 membrane protein [Arthrospira platensis str. Paraca]MBD2671552.1 carbohydrate porin [Arthrospira platensis FACHB-439]MBD2712480.1 carbohydrate porin [Arthrospira platensis FACHB-835]MDF2211088.1 iron uptake porin [Arthrospira platensis NCB002]MDT9182667.1 iron uptake porin [Limnospira sp. PMC 289.06]MDT9294751.1 iron uptake porin [Arthrospira platensis PCC 7345]MD